mgnify:CR=1 FL=1
MILLGGIKGYPEMCAEHGVPRRTSAVASSLSAFFSIFFSKYARARATGRSSVRIEFLYRLLNDRRVAACMHFPVSMHELTALACS